METEIRSTLRQEHHLVIGGGVAGALTAILKRHAGYKVTLLERRPGVNAVFPVGTDTSAVVSENHSGAEYPFDDDSARDCLESRLDNEKVFPKWIYAGKDFTRILASVATGEAHDSIVRQCRKNLAILHSHYEESIGNGACERIFGDPDQAFREVDSDIGVHNVGAVFVTPQRGLNPAFVAAALEAGLQASGVAVREGVAVRKAERLPDGRFRITAAPAASPERPEVYEVDQLTIAAACHGPAMARQLNPALQLPRLFAAVRQIELVDLPESTEHSYTCLKLEDQYGGMLSPYNKGYGLIYHPPTAHIRTLKLWEMDSRLPDDWQQLYAGSAAEIAERAERTCNKLKGYYPELRRSKIVKSFLKLAINTVDDSRVRRNLRPIAVCEGAVLLLLAKWTMCVTNAFADLALAVQTSLSRQGLPAGEAKDLARSYVASVKTSFTVPAPEAEEPAMRETLRRHCASMSFPLDLAIPMS
jgi:glycine/D-amino acid oxidase-like deaminating enzyme